MALDAGELSLTLEYAVGLKDKELFGRQDPFVVIKCGSQTSQSKTHVDGGKNPVWNQTFKFNVINENDMTLTVMENDNVLSDELIGEGHVSLTKARTSGSDRQEVLLYEGRKGKQRGTVHVSLAFVRNGADMRAPQGASTTGGYMHPPTVPLPAHPYAGHYMPTQYAAPPPAFYHQAPQPYLYGGSGGCMPAMAQHQSYISPAYPTMQPFGYQNPMH